ncbi:MAG: hypothetical protein U5K30_14825 [Acidimicrobiales bacterium]|nr:hypothetical protein [Acidimicrobiales bacterium]
MAKNPLIKRYLDAGMAFTQMTQSRAEAIVKDLVKTGEVQAQKTEELVNELLERSRRNTDKLLEVVRKEVRDQIASLGLATKDDIARVEKKVETQAAPAKKGASKKKAVKKAAKKTSPSKKKAAKKSAAKKSAAKKTSPAEKSTS